MKPRLSNPEPHLKQCVLKALNQLVPQFWAEISEHIALVDLSQGAHDSAALLASKVYYYLGKYNEALSFALGAGSTFENDPCGPGSEEYVETIVSKVIDRYISSWAAEQGDGKIDPRLQGIIEGIFRCCMYRQAIGIPLESRCLDIIKLIHEQTHDTTLLSYTMEAVLDTAFLLAYCDQVLKFLFPLFPAPTGDMKSAHVYALTRILVTLNSPEMTINFLTSLVPKQKLLAYQFAFDLVEGGGQDFLVAVRKDLLKGDNESIKLYLEFLKCNNKVDMLILKNTKDVLEPCSLIYHTALTLQNVFMHAGTTSDVFLCENLDGIHKGHFQESMNILGSTRSAAYSEGGAFYALRLVIAGCGSGQEVENYLRNLLKNLISEVVQHGAALRLSVAGIGGKSIEAYDDLKTTLFTNSAMAGEAVGYTMGLVMLSTVDGTSADGSEEANDVVKLLMAEKEPILHYGGVYILALAYAGTSNNSAICQLLHITVSDTSDDVHCAAVTNSYNPHVRCGATLALGIACAGTGLQDAVNILEPMTCNSIDFIRQGALISLGMILVKQSEVSSLSLASTCALYAKIVSDKHDDPMAHFGAVLDQGLIDAGGHNVTISLQSCAGSCNTAAIIGIVLFCQFWYWYPLAHCTCLAFEPMGIIGLDENLKAPKLEFVSNTKPSLFAYPAATKPPKKEAVTKVATAVLSTTAKAKARENRKATKAGEPIPISDEKKDNDVEMKGTEPSTLRHSDVSPISLAEGSPKGRKGEPSFEIPACAAKTTRAASFVTLAAEWYEGGSSILILADTCPDEEPDYVEFETAPVAPGAAPAASCSHTKPSANNGSSAYHSGRAGCEADPPEAFEELNLEFSSAEVAILQRELAGIDLTGLPAL
ncbi:hypothetical protein V8D89_002573 [Ganoderma adspersum]